MADTTLDAPSRGTHKPLAVVGIGASAGGIAALKAFFERVDARSGAAYVVILHLSPDHDSLLAEVLQASSTMPVAQVQNQATLEPDHVYVMPPNRSLGITDGALVLSEVTRVEQRRSPVDLFFRALADAYGSRSICVVLSGTGPNGSMGLRRVSEHGGLTIAQDPEEAQYADMPRNAIATGLVDLVLPVADIPSKIAAFLARLPRTEPGPDADAERGEMDAMRDVMTLVRLRTGHDFSNYKMATVQRRVERRVTLRNLPTVDSYAQFIREQPDEAVALMKELLISVTNFFRDPDAFAALERRVIPRLFDQKGPESQIRVWVPGCATGEEAYSVAMLLVEAASPLRDPPGIQVFATDLDDEAIATAREGLYTEAETTDIPEERLRRFFSREPAGYRIRRDLREIVLFARHNVIKDPPFLHLDLISCRNLLIYLNRSVHERLLDTFHFALRPGAFLFLGASETTDSSRGLFAAFDKLPHIYESRPGRGRLVPSETSGAPVTALRPPARITDMRLEDRISSADLHRRLLEEYASPSLVVSDDHSLVHVSPRAGRYLIIEGGEPTRELFKLLRPELRVELRPALHQAALDRTSVTVRGVAVTFDGGVSLVDAEIRPTLREGDPPRGYFLIIFREESLLTTGTEPVVEIVPDSHGTRLEEEITHVRDQLRLTIEQYETQVEEARASNEELQAMNEELRSAAEELETSKEELQSVNEELVTVNQELKIKIEELGVTNNDVQNLIHATDIGTIFLDKQLRVNLSTPRAREIFNLLDGDIGRPLSDITHHLTYDALHADVAQVLERLQAIEREVQTRDGRWHLLRILPYRTTDDRIDGVVLTLQDVNNLHRAEQRVKSSEGRLRLLIDSAIDYAMFTLDEQGQIDSWNAGAQRMYGYTTDEILGRNVAVLFTPEDRAHDTPGTQMARARQDRRVEDERWHMRKDRTRVFCSGVTTRLGAAPGLGFATVARDLTTSQQAAAAIARARNDLEHLVRQRTGDLESEVRERSAAQEHIASLLRKSVTAQEDERARIARDLHDQLGQQLTALRLTLERHRELGGTGARSQEIDRALDIARRIDVEIDFLAWQLRPAALDDLGLAAALPEFVREWSDHHGVRGEFRATGSVDGQLSKEAEIAFYRITQEALNNVLKHAHASRVDVVLGRRDGSIVLIIEDDGVGFDPSDREHDSKGIGLASMRERAVLIGATLEIESAPGRGATLFVRRPIEKPQPGTPA